MRQKKIRNPKSEDVQTLAALAALPSELLTELEQATIRTSTNQLVRVIQNIRHHDAVLADTLMNLVDS